METNNLLGFSFDDESERVAGDYFLFRRRSRDEKLSTSPLSIVYGKNGAGKSSLSRGLDPRSDKIPGPVAGLYLDENNQVKHIPIQEAVENIFVFNEDYVATKVRVDSDELGAIVLLGPQVEADEEIENIEPKLEKLNAEAESLTREIDNRDAAERTTFSNLKVAVQNTWADRQSKIEGLRNRKRVDEKTLGQLAGNDVFDQSDVSPEELRDELTAKINTISQYRTFNKDNWIPKHYLNPFKRSEVQELLETTTQQTENPHDNDIKLRLTSSLRSTTELNELIRFLDSSPHHCDRCLRDMPPEYTTYLRDLAEKALSDLNSRSQAKHIQALLVPEPVAPELPVEFQTPADAQERVLDCFNRYRTEISAINELLDKKANSPDLCQPVDFESLDRSIDALNDALVHVSSLVKAHNDLFDSQKELKQKASELNYLVTKRECLNEFTLQLQAELLLKSLQIRHADIKRKAHQLELQLNRLIQSRKETTLAIGAVNRNLSVVFGPGRLELEPATNGYHVLNHGVRVKPNQLSTGEKNVLALAHFLVSISEDKEISTVYSSKNIIILDDPISSFDVDNKYGVMMLLITELAHFHRKPSKTVTALLTHDISVAFDLSKAFIGVVSEGALSFEFSSNTLAPKDLEQVDSYRASLEHVFKAVTENEPGEIDLLSLRKLYEAFVKFNFNVGIGDALRSHPLTSYFDQVASENRRFIDRFLAGIYMNRGAHDSLSVQALDFYSLEPLSDNDKLKFAKQTLLFFHLINPWHIPARIRAKKAEQDDVKNRLDRLLRDELACL